MRLRPVVPRRPPDRSTDQWKGTKPSFFRVRPTGRDVANTMVAILAIFFSAVSKVLLNRPTDRRLAHLNAASCKEKLAPLFVGIPGTSLEVCFKQAHGASIQLRTRARGLLGGKRTILCKPLKVAPDRRTVDSEPTGGLAFGDALLYGLYYLGAQIYRIGFHLPMMSTAATSPQAAVGVPDAQGAIVLLGPDREVPLGSRMF